MRITCTCLIIVLAIIIYLCRALHARFGEALEQMAKLKAEARETKDHAVQLQDILEYQKLVAQARLQAVESKYNTLKQIVSGLEVRIALTISNIAKNSYCLSSAMYWT